MWIAVVAFLFGWWLSALCMSGEELNFGVLVHIFVAIVTVLVVVYVLSLGLISLFT